MVTTREITGSKTQILRQIEQLNGRIVSAIILIDEPARTPVAPPSQEKFADFVAAMECETVSAPHADDSREAIYTRMPGE